jgi:very-short-patch-repair endonuclease
MPSRTPGLGRARAQRRNATVVERDLWALLRDRRLDGLKFRRQVSLGRYIADFVCFDCKLIVEADGPFHDEAHDAERDRWLQSEGFEVLRFTNSMVHARQHEVISAILEAASRRRANR